MTFSADVIHWSQVHTSQVLSSFQRVAEGFWVGYNEMLHSESVARVSVSLLRGWLEIAGTVFSVNPHGQLYRAR